MNFEKNRQDLLRQLDAMKKHKADMRAKESSPDIPAETPDIALNGPDETAGGQVSLVVVFGAETPYKKIIIERLAKTCRVASFAVCETAIEFCIEHQARNIVLDMDLPTNWHESTDLHSAVKTVVPDSWFLFCSKQPGSTIVKSLSVHGGLQQKCLCR